MAADGCEAMDGLEFLTRRPEDTPLWGDGNKLLWVRHPGLMICGPQGVGKSTMAQQLMLAHTGLRAAELASHTVAGDDRPVLCGDFVETVCDKSDSCAKPANSLARADIVFNLRLTNRRYACSCHATRGGFGHAPWLRRRSHRDEQALQARLCGFRSFRLLPDFSALSLVAL